MKKVFNLLLLFITFHLLASITQLCVAPCVKVVSWACLIVTRTGKPVLRLDVRPFVPLYISILISMSIYQFETMLFSFLDVQSRVLVLQLCPLTVNTWTNILVFQTYQVKCSMQKLSRVKVEQDIFITGPPIPHALLDSTLFQ